MLFGSMFVWIPRFEYKINSSSSTIDTNIVTDITVRSTDGYIIHPAFTNNIELGGWDKEITGIWVGKFETGCETSTNGTSWYSRNNNSSTLGNVATTNAGNTGSTQIRAIVKPGMSAWRYINAGNAYENAYNFKRSLDSHLIKNSEWGAVAYFTHGKYGIGINNVITNSNSSAYTGGGSGNSYITANTTQSTTGNIYGIYDLSGGMGEYVASYNKSYSGTYYTNASYLSAKSTTFASNGGTSTKYATAYTNATTTYNYNVSDMSKKGDALKEVWKNTNYSWFNDYIYYIDLTYPILCRGLNTGGGLLASTREAGYYVSSIGYRIVCINE